MSHSTFSNRTRYFLGRDNFTSPPEKVFCHGRATVAIFFTGYSFKVLDLVIVQLLWFDLHIPYNICFKMKDGKCNARKTKWNLGPWTLARVPHTYTLISTVYRLLQSTSITIICNLICLEARCPRELIRITGERKDRIRWKLISHLKLLKHSEWCTVCGSWLGGLQWWTTDSPVMFRQCDSSFYRYSELRKW